MEKLEALIYVMKHSDDNDKMYEDCGSEQGMFELDSKYFSLCREILKKNYTEEDLNKILSKYPFNY